MKPKKQIPTIALLLVCLAAPIACAQEIPLQTDSDEARAYFERGVDMLDVWRLEKMEEALRQAIEADPSFVRAHLMLATVVTPKERTALLKRAENASPAMQRLATALEAFYAGDFEKSGKLLENILDRYPDDYVIRLWQIIVQRNLQNYERAGELAREGERRHSDRAVFLNSLGYIFVDQHRFSEAEAAFKEQIQRFPDEPNPYDSYAFLFIRLEQYDKAAELYEQVLENHPNFGKGAARNALGYTYLYRQLYDKAEATFKENIRRNPDEYNLYDSLGELYLVTGRYDEAAEQFKKALEIYPGFTVAKNNLARAHIEKANVNFENTFNRGDAEGMAKNYTSEGKLFPTGMDVQSGSAAVAAFWQAVFGMGITNAQLETIEVESHGNTAFEEGRYILSTANGQVADRGKYIVVWKRGGDGWKLHRDIWNSSVAPGTAAPTVLKRATIYAPADEVWQTVRAFGELDRFHAAAVNVELEGNGVGARRTITLPDGGKIYERLEHRDDKARTLRYRLIRSPLPVQNYTATMTVRPLDENRSEIIWKATFATNGAPMAEAQKIIGSIFETGFDGLKKLHNPLKSSL